MHDQIAAIILAAGRAARMGRPKQLLDWGGRALVRVAAEHALAAPIDQVLVVAGAARDDVAAALENLPLRIIDNPDYAVGQSTSLRAGIAALGSEVAAALVMLGDQPFVTPVILGRIIAEWRSSRAAIVA